MRLPRLNRLQRKVLLVILAIVVVPMLLAGSLAAKWVSDYFEERLERWIVEAARVDQTWLSAYQNDALMLGSVLADEPGFLERLDHTAPATLDPPLRRIASELGINFVQIYDGQRHLVSATHRTGRATWEHGQSQAVVKVAQRDKDVLAAVGITPVPRHGTPRYYLVMGSVLDQDFLGELSQLTGLGTRLYYREGKRYYDVFSHPGHLIPLAGLPDFAWQRLLTDKQPYYDVHADNGRYRGLYVPIVDSRGRVEAIMFNGLERSGFDEVLTNQLVLFFMISLIGLVIGGLMGLFLSRVVVRPIEHLHRGVMQLAGQNFNATVPMQSNDELGDLAKAFNAMAVRLREARDEQQQRFQRDKLVALGEVSAALAHEIRNPIGVINTASAMLDKAEGTRRAELLRMIREESRRVSELVQDFLELSRHRQPRAESIDPAAPLQRALAATLTDRSDIEVVQRLGHEAARIKADAGLLQQAWVNILTNAVEAIGARRGRIVVESQLERGQVLLAVEDNGPGIEAHVLPRLFEPFFTTKDRGTGLGLSIALALVEANGGTLEAMPARQGTGSRFVMRFPILELTA